MRKKIFSIMGSLLILFAITFTSGCGGGGGGTSSGGSGGSGGNGGSGGAAPTGVAGSGK